MDKPTKDKRKMEVTEEFLWARLGKLNLEKDMLIAQRDSLLQEVALLTERMVELQAQVDRRKSRTNARGKKPVKKEPEEQAE